MRVCCIGAGPAGIGCAKTMLEKGHEVTVFERKDEIGGLWRFESVGTSVNPSTVATSSRFYLAFSDFPIASDMPHFLHQEQYVAYLRRYVEQHRLDERIRLRSEVTRVRRRHDDAMWTVSVRHGSQEAEYEFDAVAVCSGLHRRQPAAETLREFCGQVLHSSEVKDYGIFSGKRVLVIGGGESGCELAHIAAQTARRAALSLKRGITVVTPYYPFPLYGQYVNPYFAQPADFAESRFLNLFSDKHYEALVTFETLIFAYPPESPGRHSLFHTFLTLLTVLLAPLHLLRAILSLCSGLFRQFVGYLRDAGVFSYRFWLPFLNRDKPWGRPESIELSAAIRQFQEQNARSLVMRDCSMASRCMERAARFRASGYDWRDYRRVRSTLAYYSGGPNRSNFYTKSDDFIYDIMEGKLQVFPKIARLDGEFIRFENGDSFAADIIVNCSGYETEFPFLEKNVNGRDLFKNVFLPGTSTLAFIGFARPEIGAMPPIAELQSRWFEAVLSGAAVLPPRDEIIKEMERDNQKAKMKKVFADRLTHSVSFVSYMDEIAKLAGCGIRYGKLLRDPKLLLHVLFGPALPAHYWLNEDGEKYEQTRQYVLNVHQVPDVMLGSQSCASRIRERREDCMTPGAGGRELSARDMKSTTETRRSA